MGSARENSKIKPQVWEYSEAIKLTSHRGVLVMEKYDLK